MSFAFGSWITWSVIPFYIVYWWFYFRIFENWLSQVSIHCRTRNKIQLKNFKYTDIKRIRIRRLHSTLITKQWRLGPNYWSLAASVYWLRDEVPEPVRWGPSVSSRRPSCTSDLPRVPQTAFGTLRRPSPVPPEGELCRATQVLSTTTPTPSVSHPTYCSRDFVLPLLQNCFLTIPSHDILPYFSLKTMKCHLFLSLSHNIQILFSITCVMPHMMTFET